VRRMAVLPAAKALASLCGAWLLLHQAFRCFSISHPVWVSVNNFSLLAHITFLVITSWKLERPQRNRTEIGCFILALGFFVLEIRPPKTSLEKVLWFHSLRLFISRASPFAGLLVLMLTWNPGRLTAILLNPIRWWMNVPLRPSVTIASYLAFLVTSAMAWFGYEGLPRVDDGVVNLYQARIFASGLFLHRYVVGSPFEGSRMRYSTTDLNDGRQSMGIYNTLSFIQEGKRYADQVTHLERRAMSQMTGMFALLEAVAKNTHDVITEVSVR
jgi:hypothetical protein